MRFARIARLAVLPLMMSAAACAPNTNQYGQPVYGQNTMLGVGGGALAGGLLGNAVSGSGNRGTGTVIGAIAGGVLGGAVGNATEQRGQPETVYVQPRQSYQQQPYGYRNDYRSRDRYGYYR